MSEPEWVPLDQASTPVPRVEVSKAFPSLEGPERWDGRKPPALVMCWDHVPIGSATLLVGDGGAGKSLLMQQQATHIAANAPLFGKPVSPGKAVYITAEDSEDDLHRRHAKIVAGLPAHKRDAWRGNLYLLSLMDLRAAPLLWEGGRASEYLLALEEQLKALGDVTFLGLDNASLLFGDNENSRTEVSPFMAHLNGLSHRLSLATKLAAHTSKTSIDEGVASQASGSTAWVYSARCAYRIGRGTEANSAWLRQFKGNYSALAKQMDLLWNLEGLLEAQAESHWIEASKQERETASAILREAETQWQRKRPLSDTKQSGSRYLPTHFRKHLPDFKPKLVQSVMEQLEYAGALVIDTPEGTRVQGFRVNQEAVPKELRS